jgi:hypothetical protein
MTDAKTRSSLALTIDRIGRFGERRAVRDGLILAGIIFAVVLAFKASGGDPYLGYDAHAYWQAASLDHPYATTIAGGFNGAGGLYEYKYPPPLAQILAPLHLLPWPVFFGLWTLLLYGTFLWLAGRWAFLVLLFPPVLGELWLGNVNLLIGAAVVLGFRSGAAWAFPILTKLTPGIGLLWFAVRREWRPLIVSLVVTGAISAISFVLAPGLWSDWFTALGTQTEATLAPLRQSAPISLPIRLAAAAAIVVWGALTDRRWVVPIAISLAVPFAWWNVFSIMIASLRLGSPRPVAVPTKATQETR